MGIKICGIDASLSSSGFALAHCNFDEKYKENLSKVLFSSIVNLKDDLLTSIIESIEFSVTMEIKEKKNDKKELAKVRKNQRDDDVPSYEDIKREEELSTGRMIYQANELINLVYKLYPDLIFMEDYSFHSQGSITQLAELRGSFKTLLYNQILDLSYIQFFKFFTAPVTSIKKISAGKGNATKPMMYEGIKRFGFNVDESNDDMIDAMCIVLSAFYAIYFRLFGLDFPECKNSKEKTIVKSWRNSLNVFANRIGTKDDIESWIR